MSLSSDSIRKAYADMLLIRRFEERVGQVYGQGLIRGFCHLYIGQEAVAVGIAHSVSSGDSVITSYRCHGLMLALGSSSESVMGELLGRQIGCSRGKGGSMHMFDPDNGFYGGHGIVGAQVSIGTGLGFAHHYKEDGGIAVSLCGDGAANQGQVYESFNMAKLWNLPCIYIIENNKYSMGTSIERGCATTDFHKRGASFGIPGFKIDGMDFFAVYEGMQKAIKHVREDRKGPIVIEMVTYRYRGHSMSDPATYRLKNEVENYKENKDPIVALKEYILKNEMAAEEELKSIEGSIKKKVKECLEVVKNSPEPDADKLYTDVLIEDGIGRI